MGATLLPRALDIRISLKLIQVLADTELRSNQVLYPLLLMSMLKYVLAFFVFIVVSLAPVFADEGYIPYFPDFLEPDGIGFRGTAEFK